VSRQLLAGGRSCRPDVFRLGGLGHFYSLSNIHGPKFASLLVDIQQFHHHSILRVTISNLARGYPNVLRDGNHHTEHSIALVARPQQVIYPFQVSGLIRPFRQIGSPIGIIGDRFSGVIQYVLPQCHDDSTAVRRAGRRAPSLAFTSRAEMRESLRQTSHDRPAVSIDPAVSRKHMNSRLGSRAPDFKLRHYALSNRDGSRRTAAAIPENAAIIALDARGEALSSRSLPGGLEDAAIGGHQP
jgi:hypothetical protein